MWDAYGRVRLVREIARGGTMRQLDRYTRFLSKMDTLKCCEDSDKTSCVKSTKNHYA